VNRRGVALAAALLVVLLGGVLVVTSITWATAELRAGASWSAQARADAAGASTLTNALPVLDSWTDSVGPGAIITLPADSVGGNLTALLLADSLLLASTESHHAGGEARLGIILRRRADSTGLHPFGVAPRFHPLP
jgi:hypothetical protein